MSFAEVNVVSIHLGAAEYGDELMYTLAEIALTNPEFRSLPNLVVMVYEHAGWFLGYTVLEGEMTIVYSANDAAAYYGKEKLFKEQASGARWNYIKTIRRT